MTTSQNEQVIKLGNWFASRLEKFEPIAFFLLIITFIIKKYTEAPVNIIVVLLFMSLAIAYFFSGHAEINDENAGVIDSFFNKLVLWGCSIGIIGILFKISLWKGSDMMIWVGCSTILLVLFIILQRKSKNPELKIYNSRYILRIIIIGFLGFLLNFTPNEVLIKKHLISVPKVEKQENSNPV